MRTNGDRRTLRRLCLTLFALFTLLITWTQAREWQARDAPRETRLNGLIAKLEKGGVVKGNERQFDEIPASGMDFDWIEMEHGPFLLDKLRDTLAQYTHGYAKKSNGTLVITPVIRIPTDGFEIQHWMVKQLLNMGAVSLVFPRIETKQQAMKAVRYMRYPPQEGYPNPPEPRGERGASGGPPSLTNFWGALTLAEYVRRADLWPLYAEGELFAIMLIETAEGVKNLNEIMKVPGIGAVMIGPNDLAMSMGLGPAPFMSEAGKERHEQAIQTILRACLANNVVCGLPPAPQDVDMRISQGFRFILDVRRNRNAPE